MEGKENSPNVWLDKKDWREKKVRKSLDLMYISYLLLEQGHES